MTQSNTQDPSKPLKTVEEHEPHYNGICKSEYERGYNFGKRDAYEELIKDGGKYKIEFQTDEVMIVIPKEKFTHLQNEAERTA